ncbi:MAG: hypothetical protein IPI88_07240 [Chitinophagaceae bacterium]|nr:hypothetical protein [Chitinophagaceae bacterium]
MSVLNTMGIKTGKTEQPNDLFNNFSDANNVENTEELPRLTFKGDTKIIIIKALDKIGKACKLSQIQEEYDRITGVPANIRESIRTLNKSKKILLMIEKGKSRGIFWVKREWVEDGVLLDEFKPYGFDSLYDAESLEYK